MTETQAQALAKRAQTHYGCPCTVIPYGMDTYAVLVKRDLLPGHAPADRFTLTNMGQARRYLG